MDSAPLSSRPLVTILMGIRNGAAHLSAQLDSIAAQTHRNWLLICGDDGSTDQSCRILRQFAQDHPGKVQLRQGPKMGFSANYMRLLEGLEPDPGYVAFADQDDIWLPGKLEQGLRHLLHRKDAAMACGRRVIWYPDTGLRLPSPQISKPPSFQNALIENVAPGNTILLNPAAARLARRAARRTGAVFAHDWWLYLLISGAGGEVCFDNGTPQILYRQHGGNLIGHTRGWLARLRRKQGVLTGTFSRHIDGNIDAMLGILPLLRPDVRRTLLHFALARQRRGLSRVAALRAIRLYRQTWQDTLAYWGATTLGRT